MARRLSVRITGIDWRDPSMVVINGEWSHERTLLRRLFHEACVAIWGEWAREFFPEMLSNRTIAFPVFAQLKYDADNADLDNERPERLKTPKDMTSCP